MNPSSSLTGVREEIHSDRPRYNAHCSLSAVARARHIERGILGLYRWYSSQSQSKRNWHPDTCVDWRSVRRDHHASIHTVIEGFFAVEQYTPDYVAPLLNLLRRSYGRSQWHVRWGAEEEKHADLWRNATLALHRRSEEWIEEYTDVLRSKEWRLPWESPLHMVFYQVIQERATQVSYLNLGLALQGKLDRLQTASDPTLVRVVRLIANDEAAHYHFFGEIARLMLYYEPEAAIGALHDVLKHFTMPARDLVPRYDAFGATLQSSGIFGRVIHYRDVVEVALKALSVESLRALEAGVRLSREIPELDGGARTAALLDTLDQEKLHRKVEQLYSRNRSHIERSGLSALVSSDFHPSLSGFNS